MRSLPKLCLLASIALAPACSEGTPTAPEPALHDPADDAPKQPAPAPTGPPDVLFIIIDDLNDWVGFLDGHPGVSTPNLDRLAGRGMRFTRAYCASPVCNPSRAAVLTGRRPYRTGVYFNNQDWREKASDAVTLPSAFRARGYDALGCGKIFHHFFQSPKEWTEYFDGGESPAPSKNAHPLNGLKGYPRHFDWGPLPGEDEDWRDGKITTWSVQKLAEEREKPLFLATGIFRPHLPWYVPQRDFNATPLADVELPPTLAYDLADLPPAGRAMADEAFHGDIVESGQWQVAVQGYLASIRFADRCVGRILDGVEQSPRADNTIIVVWGDHGWHLGEKDHWRKFALWERTCRVPLIIYAPGVTRPGARCDRTVNLIDLYPTLLELCGLEPQEDLDGVSFAGLLADPEAQWERPSLTSYGPGNHSVRSERWRYIRYADGGEELYDHESDPHEWYNLAALAEHADVRAELAAWIPTEEAQNDAPPGSK